MDKIIKIFKTFIILIFFVVLAEIGLSFNKDLSQKFEDMSSESRKYANTFVIYVVGDSVSAGYPSKLASLVRENLSKKVKIYNFARPFARRIDLQKYVSKDLSIEKPNLVILMTGAQISIFEKSNFVEESYLNRFHLGRLFAKYFQNLREKLNIKITNDKKVTINENVEIYYNILESDRLYNFALSVDQIESLKEFITKKESINLIELKTLIFVKLYLKDFIDIEKKISMLPATERSYFLGLIEERLGNFNKAEKHFLNSVNNNVCIDISRLQFAQKNNAKALEILEACLKKTKTIFHAQKIRNEIANIEISNQNYDRAIKVLNIDKITSEIESDVLASSYMHLSNVYLLKGENEKSIFYLNNAISLNPNNLVNLKIYLDAILYRVNDKKIFINTLNSILNRSIHINLISDFIAFYLSNTNSLKKDSSYLYLRFLKSLLGGTKEEATASYLDLENDFTLRLNLWEEERIIKFYKQLKDENIELLLLQIPNQKIEVLKNIYADNVDIKVIDTYKYFKMKIKNEKLDVTDLLQNDGRHLTSLGEELISNLILEKLKQEIR